MKSNILVTIGMLILLSVIATALGIWYLSNTASFSRKDQPVPASAEQPKE